MHEVTEAIIHEVRLARDLTLEKFKDSTTDGTGWVWVLVGYEDDEATEHLANVMKANDFQFCNMEDGAIRFHRYVE